MVLARGLPLASSGTPNTYREIRNDLEAGAPDCPAGRTFACSPTRSSVWRRPPGLLKGGASSVREAVNTALGLLTSSPAFLRLSSYWLPMAQPGSSGAFSNGGTSLLSQSGKNDWD